MANPRYDRIKGVGGANTQFITVLVLSLFFCFCLCILRIASWPYRWTDYDALWLIGRVFRQGSAFWGSRWWKLMFRGQNPPKILAARIGVLSQICKNFDWQYLRNYKIDRHEIWTQVSSYHIDFVGNPALPRHNSRWRKVAILNFWQNLITQPPVELDLRNFTRT